MRPKQSPSDKVSLSCDTGGQTFPKGGKEEERQLVYKHLKVKDDGEHETQAKTEEGENDHKLERIEEEWGASKKSNEQVKHEKTNVKENAETSQGNSVEVKNLGDESKGFSKHHKVPVEDRKLPIEVVELDSEEEEEESIHHSAGGVTVRLTKGSPIRQATYLKQVTPKGTTKVTTKVTSQQIKIKSCTVSLTQVRLPGAGSNLTCKDCGQDASHRSNLVPLPDAQPEQEAVKEEAISVLSWEDSKRNAWPLSFKAVEVSVHDRNGHLVPYDS